MSEKLVTKLSNRKCFTLSNDDTLKTASEKLQKYNVGVMPILSEEHNNVIGIISERDIARYIFKDEFKGDLSVTTIMSKDIISCNLGILVLPPTNIISSISDFALSLSFNSFSNKFIILLNSLLHSLLNFDLVIFI